MNPVNESSPQMWQKGEELKGQIGKIRKNLIYERDLWALHQELQLLLKKLLVNDIQYALDKKVEVDLWNFCFKDYINYLQVVSRDRTPLKKKLSQEAHVVLTWFLDMTAGFYFCLLQEIRAKHKGNFTFLKGDKFLGKHESKKDDDESESMSRSQNNNYLYLSQYCLVHLGDVSRYRNQFERAESYYRQAIQIAPGSGQAYNQIALIEASNGNILTSAFYYVRSLALRFPFLASATNLSKLMTKVESDQKSLPLKDSNGKPIRIESNTFISYALRFHALIHHSHHFKTATKICNILTESLTTLVAENVLTTWQLLQVVTIAIYQYHNNKPDSIDDNAMVTEDEKQISALICEFLAGMLNAFLLPVYTFKQDEFLLEFSAIPVIKVILDWILLNPEVLEEKGFLRRAQIWPGLCKLLNELQTILSVKKFDSDLKDNALKEDYDLQTFLPLLPRLKLCTYQKNDLSKVNSEEIGLLRANKIIEIGKLLASEDNEYKCTKLLTIETIDGQLTFQAVEQKFDDDLLKKMNSIELESSDDESDQESPLEKLTENSQVENNNKQEGRISKNVALSGLLKKDNPKNENRQIRFKSPSPSNSQDSNSMSLDGSNENKLGQNKEFNHHHYLNKLGGFQAPPPMTLPMPRFNQQINPNMNLTQNAYGNVNKTELQPTVPMMPLSNNYPPSYNIPPPNPITNSTIRFNNNMEDNDKPLPYRMPSSSSFPNLKIPPPSNPSLAMPTVSTPLMYSTDHLLKESSTWNNSAQSRLPDTNLPPPNLVNSTKHPQFGHNSTFSLFSGPNPLDSSNLNQPQLPDWQRTNLFQSGPSALEKLFQQQHKK